MKRVKSKGDNKRDSSLPENRTVSDRDELLDRPEAAAFLRVNKRTLDRWELLRKGPPRIRMGGLVRYRKSRILQWLEGQEK